MADNTTINVFFLLFGALQGLLLGFLVWRKKKNLANGFLAGIILLATFQIFHKVVSKIWLMEYLTGTYKVGYELPFLFGPFLLGYITASLNPSFRLNSRHLLHLIPFLWFATLRLLYIHVFPYNDLIFELLPYTKFRTMVHGGLQLVSLWVYTYWIIHALRKGNENSHTKWLQQFTFAVLGIETIIIIVLKLMTIYYGQYPDLRLAFLSLTLLIYWLTYQVMQLDLHESKARTQFMNGSAAKKYAHSGLKPGETEKIITEVETIIAEERLFLKPDLKIETLADRLGVSRHHLSQAINSEKKCSYYEFINAYRIKAVKVILDDPQQDQTTMAAIAYDTGFQSISNFNAVFKKTTGLTPSQYRKRRYQKGVNFSKNPS